MGLLKSSHFLAILSALSARGEGVLSFYRLLSVLLGCSCDELVTLMPFAARVRSRVLQ